MSDKGRPHMLRALALAAEAGGRVEPNPMVGAVVVKDGLVVGEGRHERFGGPHAEVNALSDVRARGCRADGATMYVTLEPCAHEGKTPPCAPALVEARLRRVVIAIADPLWQRHAAKCRTCESGRRGLDVIRRAGIETEVGLCRDEAVMLNAGFFKRAALGLPLVVVKWAMSADGKIATRTGDSRWISSEESRRIVHELRARADAVVVGSRTVARDDPLLTCRDAEPRRIAARVVLCGASAPGLDSQLVRSARAAPVLLAFCEDEPPAGLRALKDAGCEAVPLPAAEGGAGGVDVRALLATLAERGATNVLVEGGAEVLGSFLDAGLVDRMMVFVAPLVIGGSGAVTAVGGRGAEAIRDSLSLLGPVVTGQDESPVSAPATVVRIVGRDVLLDGWLHDPRGWAPDRGESDE